MATIKTMKQGTNFFIDNKRQEYIAVLRIFQSWKSFEDMKVMKAEIEQKR
jgi:hypothetical protein